MLEPTSQTPPGRDSFTVSHLNRYVKNLLEQELPLIWVEGELSNLSRPASDHWYFTLKDDGAQVRCAMFKGRNSRLKLQPKPGDKVKLRARVSLYEGRGDYQLIAEHMEEAGFGLLQKRFEELKQKLFENGYFDQEKKQQLPDCPKHLAVITSPSGAAIQDVLSVLSRRMPSIPITIIPSMVQGDEAPEQLIRAFDIAENDGRFDQILLCRGGGSIEDLWAFNSEKLALRIADCKLPVLSAVGHEVDFTIADFVSDLRAPTPSAAAEILSPDREELLLQISHLYERLTAHTGYKISREQERLEFLKRRLKHPSDKLDQWAQKLDFLDMRLKNALSNKIRSQKEKIDKLQLRVDATSPAEKIANLQAHVDRLSKELKQNTKRILSDKSRSFQHTISTLDMVSPISTLKRGYCIANHNDTIVRSAKQLNTDDQIGLTLSDGNVKAIVTETTITEN